jgi:hypothetical protein
MIVSTLSRYRELGDFVSERVVNFFESSQLVLAARGENRD